MVGQQEDHVGLHMFLGSLHDQGNHLQTSLVDDSPSSTPLKGDNLFIYKCLYE
jgi:hypothetical protein